MKNFFLYVSIIITTAGIISILIKNHIPFWSAFIVSACSIMSSAFVVGWVVKSITVKKDKSIPKPVNGICICDVPRRSVTGIGEWNGCPLEGGCHTNFTIGKCNRCGGIIGFPHHNLMLALKEGTPETKKKLLKLHSIFYDHKKAKHDIPDKIDMTADAYKFI